MIRFTFGVVALILGLALWAYCLERDRAEARRR